jgi:hypothetical protein
MGFEGDVAGRGKLLTEGVGQTHLRRVDVSSCYDWLVGYESVSTLEIHTSRLSDCYRLASLALKFNEDMCRSFPLCRRGEVMRNVRGKVKGSGGLHVAQR